MTSPRHAGWVLWALAGLTAIATLFLMGTVLGVRPGPDCADFTRFACTLHEPVSRHPVLQLLLVGTGTLGTILLFRAGDRRRAA